MPSCFYLPNWCNNTLRINGNLQAISRLPWNDSSLLLQPLLPLPENLTPQQQYDWAIQHWGIKWDCSIDIVDRTDDFLELQFLTPWKSPDIGINAIAKLFPSLTFEMHSSESGCDWQEFCCWRDGHLVHKTTGHFYQQSPLQCPQCHGDYHPEIDLNGNINFSQCFKCSWSDYKLRRNNRDRSV